MSEAKVSLLETLDKIGNMEPLFPVWLQKRVWADPEAYRMAHAAELVAFFKGWTTAKIQSHDDLIALNYRFSELETLLFGKEKKSDD